MIFRFYRVKIIARVTLLFLSLLITVYSIFSDQRYVTIVVFSLLIAAEVLELFRFLDRSNREIASFVGNVLQQDYSRQTSLPESQADFSKLSGVLNKILDDIRHSRDEAETQFQLLKYVVSNVSTGLVCVNDEGKVVFSNASFQQITGKIIKDIGSLGKNCIPLYTFLNEGKAGERKIVSAMISGKPVQLALRLTEFRAKDKKYKLCSVHDIKSELDEREVESWQKLIRVMTHEIMNSVTPINSLSHTILEELESQNASNGTLSKEVLNDMKESAATIAERTNGLMHFIAKYKAVSKLPEARFEQASLSSLVHETLVFMKQELLEKGIKTIVDAGEHDYKVKIDREMISRALINIIRNAAEALDGRENCIVSVRISGAPGSPLIEVHDNGPGIPAEILSDIFIPFFSTKKKGSGIGLSVCQQIMQLHRGTIYVTSERGIGSSFFLAF